MKKIFLLCFSFVAVSCSSPEQKAEKRDRNILKRAEFDLKCEKAKIKIVELGTGTYGADGCERRISYTVQCPAFGEECFISPQTETKK